MNQGQFCWYELMTTDAAGAAAFYGKVVGWAAEDSGMTDMTYTLLKAGKDMVGGIMTIPAHATGAPPAWIGYIAVDDVDAMAERLQQAGGTLKRPVADIPGVGRFGVVTDPQGAHFVLFQPNPGAPRIDTPPMTPGHAGWHELHAADWTSAFDFYAGLFGWTKANAIDMGPIGTYQLFSTAKPETGAMPVGGMMNKMAYSPVPYWAYYFVVPEIDAAVTRVTEAGGAVLNGPMEVPGGAWVIQGTDPQGAHFALVAPPR